MSELPDLSGLPDVHSTSPATAGPPATPSPREALEQLRDGVSEALTALTRAKKAVSAALTAERAGALGGLEKAAKRLSKATLPDIAPESLRVAALEAIEQHLARERARRRVTLVGALHQAASAAGLEVSRLGSDPPTFEIPPVTVELDFGRDEARLVYAREVVTTAPLEAEAILEGRVAAMDLIRTHGLGAAEGFDLLCRAYRMVLAASGGREGERVELVDLLLPLSLLVAERSKWRQLELGRLASVTRYQLAYYLQRLRREGLLARDGVRLDLGAATGGTTRDKRNVVFVPVGQGEGQYYLTMRLVGAAAGPEETP